MKLMTVTATIWVAIGGLSMVTAANAAVTHFNLHIPREPLDDALRDLAHQTGVQVGHFSDQAQSGLLVGPVQGSLSADDALRALLRSTGLSYRALSDSAYIVATPSALASTGGSARSSGESSDPATPTASRSMSGGQSSVPAGKEGKSGSSGRFRLAQETGGLAAGNGSLKDQAAHNDSPLQLQVVLVTAQKKIQPLQDVPVPVTALNAGALVARNQFRLEDYYTSVPGLSVTPGDTSGAPQLSIRGITTGGFTNPTVGIVIDDVPYGSSSYLDYGNEAPDVDPSDLASIEVLRGPQGTLYGASSIGGLIKYMTIDPSTAAASGRVEAGLSHVQNGAQLGYYASGAVNIPLSSELAIRASVFTHQDPGFVDNVETGQRGVNRGTTAGGRVAGLWRLSSDLSVKVSALIQEKRVDGSPDVEVGPGLGDLEQTDVIGTGWRENQIRAFSATILAKIGVLDLTSVTGYTENRDAYSYDYTPAFGSFTQSEFGVAGTPLIDHTKTNRTTQELRLTTPSGSRVEWLLGLFFSHENSLLAENLLATNPVTGAVVTDWGDFYDPNLFTEYAGFADITVHFSRRFDVQFGGRESHDEQSLTEITTGAYDPLLLGLPSPVVYPETTTTENSFTYLVTPRFRLSPHYMIYVRLASGFRPGGANANATTSALSHFNPDKTQNYEIGTKGDFFDQRLSLDASLYYIDWKDIQLQLRNPVTHYTYFANGGSAKSEGLELAAKARPVAGLTFGGWIAWGDAVLTQNLPATSTAIGLEGAELPASSRFSANASFEDDFPLRGDLDGFFGVIESYVGSREGVFTSSMQRQIYPAYAKADLRVGLRYADWTATLSVSNAFDKRGILAGGLGSLNPAAFYYTQPRTIALTVATSFH